MPENNCTILNKKLSVAFYLVKFETMFNLNSKNYGSFSW